MNRKQLQLINNCDNNNDRNLMIDALEKDNKRMRPVYALMWVATILVVMGFVGMQFKDYFVVAFIPAPFLVMTAMGLNFKGVGLI